jgi:rhombotail lipoprotein
MRKCFVDCVALVSLALGGCADSPYWHPWRNSVHQSNSSLVEFLYPDGRVPPRENSVPELHVPLRVGLTFLPARGEDGAGPDAALRQELLERVRARFKDRKFVSEIVLIPDYYLSAAHGFEALEAVRRLYSVDLLALVSYDQVMHGDANEWSLGYITIVGAYVLKGNRYDVSTLIDLAVVDPASRSLVLRAGGTDVRHGNATLVAVPVEAREKSAIGFSSAADQMIQHFDSALNEFEAEVRAGKANVRVLHKGGSGDVGGGGGVSGWLEVSLLGVLLALRRRAAAAAGRRSAA